MAAAVAGRLAIDRNQRCHKRGADQSDLYGEQQSSRIDHKRCVLAASKPYGSTVSGLWSHFDEDKQFAQWISHAGNRDNASSRSIDSTSYAGLWYCRSQSSSRTRILAVRSRRAQEVHPA